MSVLSDPGLDLARLDQLLGEGANLVHWAQHGPSARDREESLTRLHELLERIARYAPSRKPVIPTIPNALHKDSDHPEDE